jgi:Zinc dependent phospholipase C
MPPRADAYSVLAHEDTVDALWDSDLVPLLRSRFKGLSEAQVVEARAYAYGGALIQDLGYYPFGNHLFTNLTHYVRTGDFVESLIRGATDANEYAFALGALAHYASDNAGHPMAVNRGVPIMYPKVRAKVGPRALYIDDPARHVMVEFAFDVLRVARGGYVAQAYHDRIGFEVSKDALERAVRETYGLDLGDLLLSVDLAIGTYRKAVSTTIPELTRIAWRDHRDEIEARSPGITEQAFVYTLTAKDYEHAFGTSYRKPGFLARILSVLLKVVPKIGPFKPLAFEPLSPDVERLFVESAAAARRRYRAALRTLRRSDFDLRNTDFDTGDAPAAGRNRLADETYADLLHKLAKRDFKTVPEPLVVQLNAFFDDGGGNSRRSRSAALNPRVRRELQSLAARHTGS